MKKMNPVQLSYHLNVNLVKETAAFLHLRDLCSLSMVSKLYSKHMRKLDYRFKEGSYRQFCSEYESYNIKLIVDKGSELSTSSIVFQNTKRTINEKAVPYNYTWKGLLNIGIYINKAWQEFSHNKKLQEELMVIRKAMYSNLKECETIPRLRKTNDYVENDFNSPLQIFLYDFLYEQQDLYEDYDNKINNPLNAFKLKNGMSCNREQIPFSYLINDFNIIKGTFKTDEDKKKLKYARWYYCIDKPKENQSNSQMHETMLYTQQTGEISLKEDNVILKSNLKRKESEDMIEEGQNITFSIELVRKQLSSESNPVLFTLKCLYLTLTFYCQYTMRNPTQPKQLLHEYLKRYKNYIETAKNLNDILENVNVCVNYLYEEYFPAMPSFPKFSVLRMCLIIWNTELACYVDQYDSMLSCLKLALTSLYSKQMRKELKELFVTKETLAPVFNEVQDGWSMISYSKITTCSTINSSSNKTTLNVNKSIRKDTNTHHVIIEQMLSSISDMFCNEYSVFHMNSLNVVTNNIYNEIVGNFCDLIEGQIRRIYKKRVLKENLLTQKMVEEIIGYFSSLFYSQSILNKMRIRLHRTVHDVLIEIVSSSIIGNFKKYLDGNNLGLMKEFQAVDYFSKNDNPYCCTSIYKVLLDSMNDSIIPFIVREYLVMNYLSLLASEQAKDLESLEYIEKWFNDEEEKVIKANKQVKKELKRKQMPIEFDRAQRLLLSMSIKPTWNTIEQVQLLEAKYQQMEQDEDLLSLRLD